jgi:hypothetical protein
LDPFLIMSTKQTQSSFIECEIEKLLDAGMENMSDIYTKIVESTKVPRPTVRRIARDLKIRLSKKVKILSSYENRQGQS